MTRIGYALSSEEHDANDLVRFAAAAEETGFGFALISDHYHPWVGRQGNSAFVWGVLGAISRVTERLVLGTGVTAPIIRIHPAIVAQAAATATVLMPGRFFLGVGTGENLNEHVTGEPWPAPAQRLGMLEEAIEVMRRLWTGEEVSHRGNHFTVDRARIYTLPPEPPKLMVAAVWDEAIRLAGRVGDGLISTKPEADIIRSFSKAGGEGKPTFGMAHVCWAATEEEARRTVATWWPNTAVADSLDLATPADFERAAKDLSEEEIAGSIALGPDPEPHVETIRRYSEAGYENVYIHQIGPDQEGFFRFYREEVLPEVRRAIEEGAA